MTFSEIIGQPKAVQLLSRALAGNRLAHGYLFTGSDGVGKRTTAAALAGTLLCESLHEEGPCGRCKGCLKFLSGNHPDYLVIRPDGATIKIDQIRALKKDLSFPPFEAGMRIICIEDVQTMRREAANSLLKILEEPPPDNLLLLIASESQPLLPTILSRCQLIPFTPLTMEQATGVIRRNNPEMTAEDAQALAVLSGGCPGQVHQLYSDDVLELRNRCLDTLFCGGRNEAESVELALDLAGCMAALKEGLETLFDLLAIDCKERMVALLCGDKPDPGRERWNLEQLSDMVQAVDSARKGLAANCNRGLVCEVLLLELFSRSLQVREL